MWQKSLVCLGRHSSWRAYRTGEWTSGLHQAAVAIGETWVFLEFTVSQAHPFKARGWWSCRCITLCDHIHAFYRNDIWTLCDLSWIFHGCLSCCIFFWKLTSYQAELQFCARVLRISVNEIVSPRTSISAGEKAANRCVKWCWREKESRLYTNRVVLSVLQEKGAQHKDPVGITLVCMRHHKEANVTEAGGTGREGRRGGKWTWNVIPSSAFVLEHPTCGVSNT